MKFTCATCHGEHDIDDISFGSDAPVQWDLLEEGDRKRSELGSDQCIIQSHEGPHFFVRACLEIPITGTKRSFTWGVWVSLSERSFAEMCDHWTDPARTETGPYFGWLCTRIPDYPDSVFLKAVVHQRTVGLRPSVELEPTEHPLSRDQQFGITQTRVQQIVSSLLHAT